ncbi:uncharacterized protein LOC113359691 [Papaver somniferum]|uniref:uncharacterized protein LOC113359691 n=1 Tax=Papaver somniferum TaxID=3469 RepID=UPI000E6FF221|nr:uncharacterized protein LOC113359691 [Papaver somniferum]
MGPSNVGGDGGGCVILTPEGSRIEKATRLGFRASNNEVEYEAVIIGLKSVKQLDAKNVKLITDFMLSPRLEYRHADALNYLSSAVDTDTTCFVVMDFQELPSISDSHFVLALEHASGGERVTTLAQGDIKNIDNSMDVDSPVIDDSGNPVENASDWRQPYIRYLTTSELPEDEHLASKVKKNAWRYLIIEGQLYRKPVALEPFLRCISAEEGQQILAEAHEETCGNHSGGRSIAHKILTQGYFWPYMQKDAKEYAQKYVPCQEHARIPKRPANKLHPVLSPWSFAKWGLDVVGPLPRAPGGVKYVLAATDYFTKWVEAVALVHVTRIEGKVDRGVPCSLMVLPDDPKRSTGFSPFTLAYGTEAVIPTEVHLKTTKTRVVESGNNETVLDSDKELLEEQRETTLQQLVRYQQAIKLSYDRKVKERAFKPGEYVLKKTRAATMEPNCGNLGANWEGPYIVDRPVSRGSYYLRNLDAAAEGSNPKSFPNGKAAQFEPVVNNISNTLQDWPPAQLQDNRKYKFSFLAQAKCSKEVHPCVSIELHDTVT